MRRTIAIAALTLAAGCGNTTPAPSPSPTLQGRLTAEDYHRMIREDVPSIADRTDEQLDTIGTSGCKILAGQDGWLRLVKTLTDAGVPAYEAGKVGPYIVGRFCPELLGKLPNV